jgi:hypothetical protein
MFHSPFNDVFEWVTVGDAGRLAANVCEERVPQHFWRRFNRRTDQPCKQPSRSARS